MIALFMYIDIKAPLPSTGMGKTYMHNLIYYIVLVK